MKRSIYFFLMLICSAPANAQIPGYRGNRLSVDGDLFFMSALLHPNENLHSGLKSLNLKYQVNLDYIMAKNISVGLSYGMLNTGWRNHVDRYGYGSGGYDIYESYTDYYKVHSNLMGMYFKFFRDKKGSIAPYGHYQKLGISFVMSQASFVRSEDTIRGNPSISGNMLLFTYGFGKQTIFFNRVIFKYGVETSFSPTIIGWLAKQTSKDGAVNKNGETDGMTLNERVIWASFINFNVGLGLILF